MNVLKREAAAASAALVVLTTLLAAGCSSSHHAASSGSVSSTTGTSPVVSPTASPTSPAPTSTPASTGSANSPGTTATDNPTTLGNATTPPTPTITTTPANTTPCLSGTFAVVIPTTDNPVRTACLHLGTAVSVELLALRGVTWSTPTASDPTIATVLDQLTATGTHHAQVRLLHPGTVILTSHTTAGPDPSGPPSRVWTLTLTVVP